MDDMFGDEEEDGGELNADGETVAEAAATVARQVDLFEAIQVPNWFNSFFISSCLLHALLYDIFIIVCNNISYNFAMYLFYLFLSGSYGSCRSFKGREGC